MTVRRFSLIGLVVGAILCAAAAPADLETRAKKLESKPMAPCCMTNTVDVHESGASFEIRREIREMLADGKSEQEILDRYVDEYGPQILSMPVAEGFSLLPYLFPLIFVVLSGWFLIVAIRRWRAAEPAETPSAQAPPPADGVYAERLRRELEQLD